MWNQSKHRVPLGENTSLRGEWRVPLSHGSPALSPDALSQGESQDTPSTSATALTPVDALDNWEDAGLAVHSAHAEPGVVTADWYRAQARRLLREFLSSVPRSEPGATLVIIRADGSPRLFNRGQLSAAIDRLYHRPRQIIRLAVEERWSRQRVCEYLQNISLKAFEREHQAALDAVAQL